VACALDTATSDYPAEAIVAAARKGRCDRRSSLLRSETQKVLAHAPMPVLVHREP
jgi:nucleotide-binding universal stress UspA family protein